MTPTSTTHRARQVVGSEWFPIGLMLVVWIAVLVWLPAAARQGDVLRFSQIAHGGTPYVEQKVEYPPLETLLVLAIGRGSLTTVAISVALVNCVATLCCWAMLRRHWSQTTALLFLWFALPMQVFMPFRLDAVVVALTLAGIVLADVGRQGAGGVAFASAILFKVWPIVLFPMLLIKKRIRASVVALSAVAVGGLIWVVASGVDAVRQVESFRGATGWHIESIFGVVVSAYTGSQLRIEAGASRIGQIEGWQIVLLRLVTLAAMAAAWLVARHRRVDPAGGPSLAAVATLLVLSPLASPQYVVWLLPWAAIVATERRGWDVRIFTAGAVVTASMVFVVYWGEPYALRELLLLSAVRAVCIAGLAVVGFNHRSVEVTIAGSSGMPAVQPVISGADG